MNPVEVFVVPGPRLREPLRLLEEWLRDGEPVPDKFFQEMLHRVNAGHLEVLGANLEGRMVGVLVLAFRPNVSLGSTFASIEDLYVYPQARRKGVGGALLQAVDDRCRSRDISYLEAQVEEGSASTFYAALGYGCEPDVRVYSRTLAVQIGDYERSRT